MGAGAQPLGEAVTDHLARYLGPAAGVARLGTSVGPVDLLRFRPVPGSLVLATRGVSVTAGREALMALADGLAEEDLAASCSALGRFAESESSGAGSTFPAPAELRDRFDCVLVLPPLAFAEPLAELARPGGAVRFVWLVPGFEEEAQYAAEHGPAALCALLEAQRLDPSDLGRAPATTLVAPEDLQRFAGRNTAYKVEHLRGTVRIERRRPRIGQPKPVGPPATEEPKNAPTDGRIGEPSAGGTGPMVRPPGPPRAPASAPRGGGVRPAPGRPAPGEVRFSVSAAPKPERPAPTPQRRAASVDPAEAKRARIAELKTKAIEARERARARARGELPPPTWPERPVEKVAERNRAVLAAERRRGRLRPSLPRDPRR